MVSLLGISLTSLVVLAILVGSIVLSWKSYNDAKKSVQKQKDMNVADVILQDSMKGLEVKRKIAIGVTVGCSVAIVGVLLLSRGAVRDHYLSYSN